MDDIQAAVLTAKLTRLDALPGRPRGHQPRVLPRTPALPARLRRLRRGRWPHAEAASARTLAIPVYPHLSDAQVEHIADAVCDFALPRSAHRAKNTNDQHRLHHACASRLPCH